MSDDSDKSTIDPQQGVDLFDILEPLSAAHNYTAERIEAISKACVSPERVEGVAMRVHHSYVKRLRRRRLKSALLWAAFIAALGAVAYNVASLVLGYEQCECLNSARPFVFLTMLAVLVIESVRRKAWLDYKFSVNVAMDKLRELVERNRSAPADAQNSDDAPPTGGDDKKNK